jgi:Asp-tRNA(Asn)/Glu-tRNA(Gln) amidotransferase A subunit family amidase
MDLKKLSLEEILEKIKSKQIDKKAVFDYFLNRIEKYDKKLHSFNSINRD